MKNPGIPQKKIALHISLILMAFQDHRERSRQSKRVARNLNENWNYNLYVDHSMICMCMENEQKKAQNVHLIMQLHNKQAEAVISVFFFIIKKVLQRPL